MHPPPGDPSPPPARGRVHPGGVAVVRWGLPDAVLVWVAGLVGGMVGGTLWATAVGVRGDAVADDPGVFVAGIVGQLGSMLGVLAWVSLRKGRGSLVADFGLRIRARDGWYLPAGLALQVVLGVALLPISLLLDRNQDVVNRIRDAGGVELVVLAVAAGLVAPVVEEVLFRGLLLRALLRRTSGTAAVAGSALVFGLVHLLDPSAIGVVPGLVALGVVNGLEAVRTGSLSRPILLHIGFNALVVVGALTG